MNNVNWVQIAAFGFVVLVVFLVGAGLLIPGSVVGGMMGPGMMGGWGFAPFGWLFMLLWMAIPLSVLVLLVLGIAWVFRQVSGAPNRRPKADAAQINAPPEPASGQTCTICGRPVQADWRLCPHCGQEVT